MKAITPNETVKTTWGEWAARCGQRIHSGDSNGVTSVIEYATPEEAATELARWASFVCH